MLIIFTFAVLSRIVELSVAVNWLWRVRCPTRMAPFAAHGHTRYLRKKQVLICVNIGHMTLIFMQKSADWRHLEWRSHLLLAMSPRRLLVFVSPSHWEHHLRWMANCCWANRHSFLFFDHVLRCFLHAFVINVSPMCCTRTTLATISFVFWFYAFIFIMLTLMLYNDAVIHSDLDLSWRYRYISLPQSVDDFILNYAAYKSSTRTCESVETIGMKSSYIIISTITMKM